MARRRRSFARRAGSAVRYVTRKVRRSGRRSAKGGIMNTILGGALYGLARQPIANLTAPLTGSLPLGQYNDEAVMAIVSWLAAKKGSGLLASAGRAGLAVEAARIAGGVTGNMSGGVVGGAF
jgi:hypothetical protein